MLGFSVYFASAKDVSPRAWDFLRSSSSISTTPRARSALSCCSLYRSIRGFRLEFFRSSDTSNDRADHAVLAFCLLALGALHPQSEGRLHALIPEGLRSNLYGKHSYQIPLPVGGFITMTFQIPGENANLVVVPGQAIFVVR